MSAEVAAAKAAATAAAKAAAMAFRRPRACAQRRWLHAFPRLCVLAPCLILAACSDSLPEPAGRSDLSALLAAPQGDYSAVSPPAALVFPRDHGAHPRHRIEWWYLTANLEDAEARHYGLQFALFRIALAPGGASEGWQARQVYMLHTALTDTDAGRFHHGERLARPAAGLAGVQSAPFAAWLEDCGLQQVESPAAAVESPAAAQDWTLQLACRGEAYAIELRLQPAKPLVRHGEDGYSAKVPGGALASYYVSYTRMAAEGVLSIDGREVPVRGSAWYDHEWSSALLGDMHAGWDWFALQLDDGSELMLFRIRDTRGQAVAVSGTLVTPDGRARSFAEGVVEADPVRTWSSPETGARYPVAWRLRSEALDFALEIEPRLDAQELRTRVRYWEGAVTARGTHEGRAVEGVGYLELTGYAR